MKVRYFGPVPGGHGNVIWAGAVPMRGGKFPPPHPCHENPEPTVFGRDDQPVSEDPLGQLRARGYLASCFPEGDGISFEPPPGRSHKQIVRDLVECFGFVVVVMRP